ncbi:Asp-tRNA(Asn)/Glu-tRNA(Gln) amidotransferase subunit GatC [Candidatus Roizmanbacteria bacterium]|nr:Asp-tRNA(Asn)/Glu-tRNA(Gln) amidotransferase subunit GatC [Candidatus Roizmanbacteria bacterium]
MAQQITLTPDEIKHLALLANLFISDEEIDKYQVQFAETIAYVENLDELDTELVTPTSHSVPLENVYFADGTKNEKGLSQAQAISNTKKIKNGCFVVGRIM